MSTPYRRKPDYYRSSKQKVEDLVYNGTPLEQAKRIVARDELRGEIDRIEDLADVRRVLFAAFPEITT